MKNSFLPIWRISLLLLILLLLLQLFTGTLTLPVELVDFHLAADSSFRLNLPVRSGSPFGTEIRFRPESCRGNAVLLQTGAPPGGAAILRSGNELFLSAGDAVLNRIVFSGKLGVLQPGREHRLFLDVSDGVLRWSLMHPGAPSQAGQAALPDPAYALTQISVMPENSSFGKEVFFRFRTDSPLPPALILTIILSVLLGLPLPSLPKPVLRHALSAGLFFILLTVSCVSMNFGLERNVLFCVMLLSLAGFLAETLFLCRAGKILSFLTAHPVRACLLIFLLTVLWFGVFAMIHFDLHHDGIMLKPALDTASGMIPYRETFLFYGYLTTLLQSAVCRFSPLLLSLHMETVFWYGICAVLLYLLSRQILPGSAAFLPFWPFWVLSPVLFISFFPWSSVFALAFLLGGMLLTVKYLTAPERNSLLLPFSAGLLTAAAAWCKQPSLLSLGVFPVLAFCIAFRGNKRTAFRFLAAAWGGALFLSALLLFWLMKQHALPDFRNQNLYFPYLWAQNFRGNWFVRIIQPYFLSTNFYTLTVWILLFELCRSGIRFFRKDVSPEERTGMLLRISVCLFAGSSLHQYYPIACALHCYYAAVPAFPVVSWFALDLRNALPEGHFLRTAVLLGFVLFPLWTEIGYLPVRKSDFFARYTRLESLREPEFLRGMLVREETARSIRSFCGKLRTLPPEKQHYPVVNLTRDALNGLFFPNRSNWNKLYLNWFNDGQENLLQAFPDFYAELGSFLRTHPAILLLREQDRPPRGFRLFTQMPFGGRPVNVFLPE